MRLPWSRSGMVLSDTVIPRASRSARQGARPVTTSGRDSSNTPLTGKDARGHLDEGFPLEFVVEPHPVEGRECIGAREGRDAIDVEPDQPVRGARRTTAGCGRRREIGEVRRGDHPEQVVGAVVERDLLARRCPGLAEVGVAREDTHDDRRGVLPRVLAHDRHRAHASRSLLEPVRRRRVDDPDLGEGFPDLRVPLRTDTVTDDVAVEQGRRSPGRVCATATNESSAVGTQMTMSANARSARSCPSPARRCSHSTSESLERAWA